MKFPRRLLAITMGDPAGVGPEVCLKALHRQAEGNGRSQVNDDRECDLILIGDAKVLAKMNALSGLAIPPLATTLGEATALARGQGTSLLHVEALGADWSPGIVSAATGHASYRYITTAIESALTSAVDAIVTGPIHKEALRMSGVPYPGHTEIFAALTRSHSAVTNAASASTSTRQRDACMMLTSAALTCSFVTTHVGLCDVPQLISLERVLEVIELTDEAMRRIKGRASRLAVCGLNPHAGENGLFGNREEERFIIPAIEAARDQGIDVQGPLPADTAFLPARRARTDAFVCMYHDQGHIPLKALSFESAVNTTLGLPIIRTSVDHGTALDIAWQRCEADSTSMVEAIRLAVRLSDPSGEAGDAWGLSQLSPAQHTISVGSE